MKIKHISLFGTTFAYTNFREFLSIYKDIFIFNDYRFTPTVEKPLIIDGGSHSGVSVAYFKTKYPSARIISFEPNPYTFKVLEQTVKRNNFKNVELHNVALGSQKRSGVLHISKSVESDPGTWSWGDSLIAQAWHTGENTRKVGIQIETLSGYLSKPVDLLKLDIEGAEVEVLLESKSLLHNVKTIILELHMYPEYKINRLSNLLALFDEVGFSYVLKHTPGLYIKRDILSSEHRTHLIIYAYNKK